MQAKQQENTGSPLIVRFLGPRKTVLMEILTIRGVFMGGILKTGIYEVKSPYFFIKHSTGKVFLYVAPTFFIWAAKNVNYMIFELKNLSPS